MPQAAIIPIASFVAGATTSIAGAAGLSAATAIKIGAIAAKVTTAAIKVTLLAGVNAVIANQNKPRSQGGLINMTISPNEPRRLQIGKRLNPGVLVDWYVKGSKNNNLFMIIYLGEGPMGQVSRVFAGGRVVHSTPLVHATRTAIPGFRSTEGGEGGNRLWITYYDGRPGQTADAPLVAESVGWTTNHIGTGCAYAIVECLWDSDNLRSPPQLGFELEGAKFYDRRLDTTAGGSGSHRADNPATWALSDNPAVALDHYLLGRYLSSVKTFGVGLDAEDVPYARFAALANLCDEAVDLKAGGTQKRYQANGFLFADRSYADTIKDLCRAMNARPADFGGRIGVIDSEERTPVMTLSDGDVIESAAEQYSPKRSWGELVSVVRGTFQDPLQNYQSAEYPRVTDATWVTEDGGSPKEATLDFEMETSAERAQRLAYLYAVRERRQAQLTGTYGLRAIELEQGDWFIRSGGIFGTSPGKVFEVIDRALDVASMTVTLTAFEVDPADSAWDENIAADPLPAPISSDDLLQAMEVPALTVTGITLTGTAAQLPAIRVQWTAPTDPRALQILVEAVPTAGGVPTSAIVDVGTGEVTFTSGITDDTNYLVRARFIGTFTPSAWTSTYAVTTLGDYSVGAATSVPWSGVTGAGKPDDNADVTGDNTAAAITGQGWGATAAEAAASNAQVPTGSNAAPNSDFSYGAATFPPAGWVAGWDGNAGVSIIREMQTVDTNRRAVKAVANGTPAAGTVFDIANIASDAKTVLACRPGDVVGASALVANNASASGVDVAIFWFTASLAYLAETHGAVVSSNNDPADSASDYALASVVATAPAGAYFCGMFFRVHAAGTAFAAGWAMEPMLARLPAGQTKVPPYAPTYAFRGADPTIDNTAAAITGQGALATESSADYRTQIDNVPPDTANLILTQDFANGAGSWASAASDVVTVTGQEFTHALRLVSGGSGIQYENNFKPCRPGEKIFYRAMVNTSGAATGARVGIHITDSAGGNAQFIITNVAGGTAWTLFSGLATAGANARRFRMFIFRQVGAASTETPLLAQPFKARYTPGADPTIDNTAAAITGQGALATKGSVDLATGEVTNKTASNIVYSGAVSIESLKPGEVGANVTESRTAAAITGQGWGATASEAAASNANIPSNNVNRVPRALFENGRNDWVAYTNGPAVAYEGPLNFAGKKYLSFNAAATGSGQIIGTVGQLCRCSPGERLSASAILQSYGTSTIDFTWLTIQFFDASEAYISQSDAQVITGPALGFPVTRGGFVTAPAGAAFCRMFAFCRSTTSGQLHLDLAEPMIAGAHPLQAVLPAFNSPINAQDNADVTGVNTAAAITGQGPGATAAADAVLNGYANYGVRKGFNFSSDLEGATATGTLTWVAGVARWVSTATDQNIFTTINLAGRSVPKIRMRLRPTSATFTWEGVVYYNTSGHGYSASFYKAIAAPIGLAQNVWVIAEWDMTNLSAGGTDWIDNTIISTRFDITNGSGETWEIDWIAFGDFSPDPVGIRGIEDNADPTIDNTAAAINAQGSQATANHQRGSTYSGTPTEGSWWSDTSTNQLKLYTGGAWQIVATIGNQNITITRTNGFVKTRIGNGTNTTNSVSFSATGGSGAGYTFAHELFVTYTSGPSATISSSSGTPITASATGVVGDEVRGFVQTTCTDSAGNKSTLVSPLALFWEL